MLENQVSSTPPTTTDSSDQKMQDGAGRPWTSLGQSPGLQMAWRRLPVFRSDMERRSAVVSLIVWPGPSAMLAPGSLQHLKKERDYCIRHVSKTYEFARTRYICNAGTAWL